VADLPAEPEAAVRGSDRCLVLRQELFRVEQRPAEAFQAFRLRRLRNDVRDRRLQFDVGWRAAECCAIELVLMFGQIPASDSLGMHHRPNCSGSEIFGRSY
jgi:hypothetical protein